MSYSLCGLASSSARPVRRWNIKSHSPVETLCFVTYDREKLYVGCRAADPDMSELRANLADRDVPRNDDTVGFMIDTFNDGRRAFQFRVNARGVQMDAIGGFSRRWVTRGSGEVFHLSRGTVIFTRC